MRVMATYGTPLRLVRDSEPKVALLERHALVGGCRAREVDDFGHLREGKEPCGEVEWSRWEAPVAVAAVAAHLRAAEGELRWITGRVSRPLHRTRGAEARRAYFHRLATKA